jgi:iron complex transport system substrate-binding protein
MQRLLFFFCISFFAQACMFDDRAPQTAVVVEIIQPEYAKGFEIALMSDSSYRIKLFNLESGGEPLQVINWKKKPIERIACLSTTHIAFIQQLGHLEQLKGTGFADLIKNEEVKSKVASGQILDLSIGHETDDEKVFSIQPQLFFVYPFGGTDYRKFLDKEIGCVQISEYLETHPLGRAEWIKVFGVLLGEEVKAKQIFDDIANRYRTLVQEVKLSGQEIPTVFTGSYDSGNWYAPPGNSFASRLLSDAGARYIFSDTTTTGNLIIPFENLLKSAYNVDFWGKILAEEDEVTMTSFSGGDERLSGMKSFKIGNTFYCNTTACDYHGDAVLEPEVMLKDLIAIFHPELIGEYQAHYFHKMNLGN